MIPLYHKRYLSFLDVNERKYRDSFYTSMSTAIKLLENKLIQIHAIELLIPVFINGSVIVSISQIRENKKSGVTIQLHSSYRY